MKNHFRFQTGSTANILFHDKITYTKETSYLSCISFFPIQWAHQSDIPEEKSIITFSAMSISKEDILIFGSNLRQLYILQQYKMTEKRQEAFDLNQK